MSREIKFRAWDGEAMYSQEDIGDDYDFVIGGESSLALTVNQQFHECGSGVAEEYWQYVTVDAEFMQWTGLQACNGIDIYEGDIIYLAGYGNYVAEFPFIELYEAAAENDIGGIIGNIHQHEAIKWKT